jgi:hypothetical protein
MEQNLKLIDIFTENKDGETLVTRKGNRYITMMIGNGEDDAIYESLFFSKKAHWKTEVVFEAFGLTAPAFEEIASQKEDGSWELTLGAFDQIIGESFSGVTGENKGGYKCIIKWNKATTAEDIEVRDNGTDASETVQDAIDNEVYGEEEEDDVPF